MALKNLFEADENYYVPFLDLMSGVVFVLMIVLSGELMNIKYPLPTISTSSAQPVQSAQILQIEPIEKFKRDLLSSISSFLKKYKIKNQVSEDSNFLMIYADDLFSKRSLNLSENGSFISSKVSEAFTRYLFENPEIEKYKNYIHSISIDVLSPRAKESEALEISQSLVFLGNLAKLNPAFLAFSNTYSPRLIHLNDKRSIPENLLKFLEKSPLESVIINFDFFYPQNKQVLW